MTYFSLAYLNFRHKFLEREERKQYKGGNLGLTTSPEQNNSEKNHMQKVQGSKAAKRGLDLFFFKLLSVKDLS